MGRQKKPADRGRREAPQQGSDQRGRRFLVFWVPIIAVVILFFYFMMFDPSRPIGQPLQGTSKSDQPAQLGESGRHASRVVLDDGRVVMIEGSLMEALKSGRRVLVQENTTLVFNRKFFSFVRYLD